MPLDDSIVIPAYNEAAALPETLASDLIFSTTLLRKLRPADSGLGQPHDCSAVGRSFAQMLRVLA
jgi:hypothetical protein